ncbi:hypothetical protein RV10_GL002789 [Enterococcus pallens]|nr:hypothetical protein RV10_GL002789 [Enterococcus pallens]
MREHSNKESVFGSIQLKNLGLEKNVQKVQNKVKLVKG